MKEEERVECPFCSELILPGAKKCCFCKEWIGEDKKDFEEAEEVVQEASVEEESVVVAVASGHKGGGFRWSVALLVVLYVALTIAVVLYEVNAREVLEYARKLEKENKHNVAHLAYQTVAKKYSLSSAAPQAMIGLLRTDVYPSTLDFPEPEATFLERASRGRFNSYVHYGLPLVVSVVCCALCILMVLVRVSQSRPAVMVVLFLAVISGLFLVVQATAYDWINVSRPYEDLSIIILPKN